MVEERMIIKAVRDYSRSKLSRADAKIFDGIVKDVF